MNKDKKNQKISKENTTMVCPTCGGTMRRDGKMWICESCDHEIPVDTDY